MAANTASAGTRCATTGSIRSRASHASTSNRASGSTNCATCGRGLPSTRSARLRRQVLLTVRLRRCSDAEVRTTPEIEDDWGCLLGPRQITHSTLREPDG